MRWTMRSGRGHPVTAPATATGKIGDAAVGAGDWLWPPRFPLERRPRQLAAGAAVCDGGVRVHAWTEVIPYQVEILQWPGREVSYDDIRLPVAIHMLVINRREREGKRKRGQKSEKSDHSSTI